MAANERTHNGPSMEHPTQLWSHINDGDWLEEVGQRITLPKGSVLAKADEVPKYCYYVLRGRVMSYEYTLAGKKRVYNFNEEGSLLLEGNLLTRVAPPVSFVAETKVDLLRISREDLMKRIFIEPEAALDIILSLSYKFMTTMDQIRETTHYNVSWKLCNLLISFAERYGVDYDGKLLIKEKISQQMMANLLGVNRITLVRIFKELREKNLIEQINGYYCIRNMEKLKRYMDEEEIRAVSVYD